MMCKFAKTSKAKRRRVAPREQTSEPVLTRTGINPDGVACYDYAYQRTRTKKTPEGPKTETTDIVWHPVVDLVHGTIDCDCPQFNFRLFPDSRDHNVRPDIGTPRYQCKHLLAAVADCIDRREIILTLAPYKRSRRS